MMQPARIIPLPFSPSACCHDEVPFVASESQAGLHSHPAPMVRKEWFLFLANVPMLDQASSHFWSRGFRSAFRIPSQHLPHSKLVSGLLKRVDWALCCYKITSHGRAFSLCSRAGGSPYLRPKANQTSESGYS